MTYFCFIESTILAVPHMEPLSADNPEDAAQEASQLLAGHSSGIAAHVFAGEERIHSILAGEARHDAS